MSHNVTKCKFFSYFYLGGGGRGPEHVMSKVD